ncbi:DUF58 domain-containing protein [Bremerella sp. T1]|uniref:DUF58 domain-containing protein n=1 Tax=Bremerella sp. TYQ1 TaxID=3119568 RepID=UPI001CC9FD77|nr:DUF58 domain-containing protein [Bremerella volcania]UBM37238.1 DUF58 domain-containing protein [Bremerella volcania]
MSDSESSNSRWSWLTTDYTPWANRYVYWLKTPIGILLALAVIALLMGLFVTPQGYVLLLTILAVVGLGIVWPWVGLRGISCKLCFRTRRCREGEKTDVVVEIVNRWPLPVWGLAIENGFFIENHSEDGPTAAVALARIPGWSRCQFVWQFQPLQRGVYPQAPPLIVTEFPFGLWKAHRLVSVEKELTVWPKSYRLSNFPLPQGNHHSVTSPSDHRIGHEGERTSVRAFRQGDSLRSIHWSLTARHCRFIVSERQGSAQTRARIFVDLAQNSHDGMGPDGTFEWTIRVAASIAMELVQQHNVVVFDFGTHEEQMTGSQASIHRAMDRLARLTPTSQDSFARKANAGCDWSVLITTDRSSLEMPTSRAIVLRSAGFESTSLVTNRITTLPTPNIRPWISVESHDTAARQLLSQWSLKSREVWCGS